MKLLPTLNMKYAFLGYETITNFKFYRQYDVNNMLVFVCKYTKPNL